MRKGASIETRCTSEEAKYPPYPVFVDLAVAKVLVVGGGAVASRKVESLLSYGADVVVVAPHACERIDTLAQQGALSWLQREFEDGDVHGARYVISAADDREVNRRVSSAAQEQGILVNVVDDPELCSAIVPAVVRRGKLQIAISTSGAAPSAARRLREELEERYAAHWENYLDVVGQVREMIKERVSGPARSRTPLYEALTDGELERRFAAGERPSAQEVFDSFIEPRLAGDAR